MDPATLPPFSAATSNILPAGETGPLPSYDQLTVTDKNNLAIQAYYQLTNPVAASNGPVINNPIPNPTPAGATPTASGSGTVAPSDTGSGISGNTMLLIGIAVVLIGLYMYSRKSSSITASPKG